MPSLFIKLPIEKKKHLIEKTSQLLDIADVVVEKDFWVCWLLEKLFTLPTNMVFKGGTSLSKAYQLIDRFSEDIDITIDYRDFNQAIDLENISRSQLKKISAKLKEQLKDFAKHTILPYLEKEIKTSFGNNDFKIEVSNDGEQFHFFYPSIFSGEIGYLRDHILLEFGIRNSVEPAEICNISPYLEMVVNEGILLPKSNISTLSPIRTFWEKATLIHVECHRSRLNSSPERLSRHWYDMYRLSNTKIANNALIYKNILKSVVTYKKAFFNASYTNYDDCLIGKLRLIPDVAGQHTLTKDFNRMLDAGMFSKKPPSFKLILEALKFLEDRINK